MLKSQLKAENATLRQQLSEAKAPSIIRITTGGIQLLTAEEAVSILSRLKAGRVVTIVMPKRH